MKAKVKSSARLFGLACLASSLALPASSALPHSTNDRFRPLEYLRPGASKSAPGRNNVLSKKANSVFSELPLSFEANKGQTDSEVKFFSRGAGYNLFLTSTEVVMGLRIANFKSRNVGSQIAIGDLPEPQSAIIDRSATVRMRPLGASVSARVVGLDKLESISNYFMGGDPKKWRTNVPNYSRVKYNSIYPGVDLVFYGNNRQLEYDFIVAPGADLRSIRIALDGARGIRMDDAGDLVVDTSVGEIRQRKPVIYQVVRGEKQPVRGNYLIAGEREFAFNIPQYDHTLALVIDPVLVYSTSIGGLSNDSANGVALDAAGNAYVTGVTTSLDFPTVNAFQPGLNVGVNIGIPSDAFVMKLNASGTALVYSTYLGGGNNDIANAIAVDGAGNAYVTGQTVSDDFPTANAFQTRRSVGGDAFVTKLNAGGNALVYSTRLGGPAFEFGFLPSNVGRGIAVDAQGNAFVTGYTFSADFPLRKPAQREFNRGGPVGCCGCLYFFAPSPSPREDGFVARLNASGDGLVFSTYLGGRGQDEAFAIAIDSAGSAYVTGRTCGSGFTQTGPVGGIDGFLVKLSPSGKEFIYQLALGGSGNDEATGVAVDRAGSAYVIGQTRSSNFPVTQNAFLPALSGGTFYATEDGGAQWQPATTGLSNFRVNVLAIDPTNPLKIYAGVSSAETGGLFTPNGLFGSTDRGVTCHRIPLPFTSFVAAIVVDPKDPSTIYADQFKSTDGGGTWTIMRGVEVGCAGTQLLIDPVNTATLYLLSRASVCGDVGTVPRLFKTTDGGSTWSIIRSGANAFGPSSVVIDPKNPSTLYATSSDLLKSTDGGATWNVTHQGRRSFSKVFTDPTSSSVLYLTDQTGHLLKSTDAGTTFVTLDQFIIPDNVSVTDVLVDPLNSSTVYAATGSVGFNGGVLKSTDGGLSWKQTDLIGVPVTTLAIDPTNSSRVYAGAYPDLDSFVTKFNPAGSALDYSTYFGTRSRDTASSIGVDEAGNAYVSGSTLSDRLPRIDALQATKPNLPGEATTFAMKLSPTGSALIFSTYLGGNEPSSASAIAVDATGKMAVVGTTGAAQPTATSTLPGSVHGGFDAFVIKIVSPPRIAAASVSGKNLIVTGEGFDGGAVMLVDGVEQRTRNDDSKPATMLTGRKAAKNIAPGQPTNIRIRNSDGLLSESFNFTRLP